MQHDEKKKLYRMKNKAKEREVKTMSNEKVKVVSRIFQGNENLS